VRVVFTPDGWDEFLHWARESADEHKRILDLIEGCRRSPFRGIGKPEPLKGHLTGYWSRRITGQHRLVYAVKGNGEDQHIVIVQCRLHY
jgi:toxin YoeB